MLADAHMLRNSPRATKLAELPRHSHMPVLGRQLQCSALAQHHLQQGMYMEFIWNVYGMYMACKWNVYCSSSYRFSLVFPSAGFTP